MPFRAWLPEKPLIFVIILYHRFYHNSFITSHRFLLYNSEKNFFLSTSKRMFGVHDIENPIKLLVLAG